MSTEWTAGAMGGMTGEQGKREDTDTTVLVAARRFLEDGMEAENRPRG